jgi:phosphoglycolate phosphatase
MLQRLANHTRLAVLTNKPRSASTRILEGLGLLGFFQDVIGGDSPLGRKPDTRGLLALVSGAGTTPHATLLVGDSAVDLRTARSAGTRVCLARFGFGFNAAISDLREGEFAIDEPAELTRIVEMLGH